MGIVTKVKTKLLDVHCEDDVNTKWSEGYLSALVDHGIINEGQFDGLIAWIKTGE